MSKGRLEAFSDGVMAILITIMVLELRAPADAGWSALVPMVPVALSYVLSFVFLGIYWCNHHHLLQAAKHVDGRVLWANLHLLFWLSLIPFVTAWAGENHLAPVPVALYGGVFLCASVAYYGLVRSLLAVHDSESVLAVAIGKDLKGKASVALYVLAIPLAFVGTQWSMAVYVLVAILWLAPDRRIEHRMAR